LLFFAPRGALSATKISLDFYWIFFFLLLNIGADTIYSKELVAGLAQHLHAI